MVVDAANNPVPRCVTAQVYRSAKRSDQSETIAAKQICLQDLKVSLKLLWFLEVGESPAWSRVYGSLKFQIRHCESLTATAKLGFRINFLHTNRPGLGLHQWKQLRVGQMLASRKTTKYSTTKTLWIELQYIMKYPDHRTDGLPKALACDRKANSQSKCHMCGSGDCLV